MPDDVFPVSVGGVWQPSSDAGGTFTAFNPQTGEVLPGEYPVSGAADLATVLAVAAEATTALQTVPAKVRATFLERFADLLEADADALTRMAHQETALPLTGRLLQNELPRTTGQLREAAQCVRERLWVRPVIDTHLGLRSMLGPMHGAAVVFGPNNFPFAFNAVSGGDFAAAIAAGLPVIAKAHPAHPGTSRLLAQHALEAVQATPGLPTGTVQMLYHLSPELGRRLVGDRRVAATAFTGSRTGGLALKGAADAQSIPFYGELSSVNPVIILPGALQERLEALADELFTSCTLGSGQFCTNPGLVLVPDGDTGREFVAALTQRFTAAPPGVLFTRDAPPHLEEVVGRLQGAGAQIEAGGRASGPGFRFTPTLLSVLGEVMVQNPQLLGQEAFGPVCLVVLVRGLEGFQAALSILEGNLTGTLYSAADGTDDALYAALAPLLRVRVGRLINDRMPTGVAVSPAQQHGGPFPATTHPGFTSVGLPAAITRFAALQSYDHVRDARLPEELRDANPLGIQRCVDRVWTAKPLSQPGDHQE